MMVRQKKKKKKKKKDEGRGGEKKNNQKKQQPLPFFFFFFFFFLVVVVIIIVFFFFFFFFVVVVVLLLLSFFFFLSSSSFSLYTLVVTATWPRSNSSATWRGVSQRRRAVSSSRSGAPASLGCGCRRHRRRGCDRSGYCRRASNMPPQSRAATPSVRVVAGRACAACSSASARHLVTRPPSSMRGRSCLIQRGCVVLPERSPAEKKIFLIKKQGKKNFILIPARILSCSQWRT